jgi:hypothetical protein
VLDALRGKPEGAARARNARALAAKWGHSTIATLYKDGGWTATEIAKNFDAAFADHLSVPGVAMKLVENRAAAKAAVAKAGAPSAPAKA